MTRQSEVRLAGPRWWPVVPLCLFLLLLGCLGWTGVYLPEGAEAFWAEEESAVWQAAGAWGWRAEDGGPGHSHRAHHAAVRRVRSADEAEPGERAGRVEREPGHNEWVRAEERRLMAGPVRRQGPARAPPVA